MPGPAAPSIPPETGSPHTKRWGLLLLRVSTGWLLVPWGIDQLQNAAYAQAVAETYYFGIETHFVVQQILGVLEINWRSP